MKIKFFLIRTLLALIFIGGSGGAYSWSPNSQNIQTLERVLQSSDFLEISKSPIYKIWEKNFGFAEPILKTAPEVVAIKLNKNLPDFLAEIHGFSRFAQSVRREKILFHPSKSELLDFYLSQSRFFQSSWSRVLESLRSTYKVAPLARKESYFAEQALDMTLKRVRRESVVDAMNPAFLADAKGFLTSAVTQMRQCLHEKQRNPLLEKKSFKDYLVSQLVIGEVQTLSGYVVGKGLSHLKKTENTQTQNKSTFDIIEVGMKEFEFDEVFPDLVMQAVGDGFSTWALRRVDAKKNIRTLMGRTIRYISVREGIKVADAFLFWGKVPDRIRSELGMLKPEQEKEFQQEPFAPWDQVQDRAVYNAVWQVAAAPEAIIRYDFFNGVLCLAEKKLGTKAYESVRLGTYGARIAWGFGYNMLYFSLRSQLTEP